MPVVSPTAPAVPPDMGDLIPYRPPHAPKESTALVGMVIFLASWAMMFAALFLSYYLVRSSSAAWPPRDLPRLPRLLPGVNTFVLFGSSVALQLAVVGVRRGWARLVAPAVVFAALCGAIFLGLQIHLWTRLAAAGLRPSTGTYASVFYGLTWFHALHVVIGVVALAVIAVRALRGAYTTPRHLGLRLWTLYWHFVGVIWLIMFVTMFLV